mgnify:CR=1 FL=1
MNLAILTGASAGLGGEYLKRLAAEPSLDRIWIIARRADRLQKLCEQYPDKEIVALPLDLTDEGSFAVLREKLEQEKPNLRLLINNAGFGTVGDFSDMDLSSQTAMTDLNVRALTALSNLALGYMTRGAVILNVCSIASFCPNTRMTVYSSTKAYVMSFTKGLREELKPLGVNALAVCPGPMNTEFLDVANIAGRSKMFKTLPYSDPDAVADKAVVKAARGRCVYTHLLLFKFYRVLAKLLPHNIMMQFCKT